MRRFSLVLLLASAAVARADDEPPSVSADVAEEDGEALSGDEEALLPTPDGPICLRDAVRVRHQRRPREEVSIPLTHCDGRPNVEAVLALSVIARPWPLPRPSEEELRAWATQTEPAARRWIADGRRRIHPGLLVRLQALADRWPDRSFVIVSGHRPNARPTSRHRFGRALDLQVEGVDRFEVASFAQTLAHTGVGYYPNSTFTHVDVRERPAYWVDRSGPGEPPDYGPWPPPGEGEAYASRGSDDDARRHAMLAQLEHALDELRIDVPGAARGTDERPRPAAPPRPPAAPAPRVARRALDPAAESIRREAFEALEGLRRVRLAAPTAAQRGPSAAGGTAEVDWTVPW